MLTAEQNRMLTEVGPGTPMGNAFTETSTSSAAEFFGLYTEDDMEEARTSGPDFGFDDDNNE